MANPFEGAADPPNPFAAEDEAVVLCSGRRPKTYVSMSCLEFHFGGAPLGQPPNKIAFVDASSKAKLEGTIGNG